MSKKLEAFNKSLMKKDLPEIRPGYTVKIYQKMKEGDKHKVQTFEGLVLAKKHGNGLSGTITVRKVSLGVGVEKIFPIHSPLVEKIEILKKGKVRRSKLYYLRTAKGKNARLKRKDLADVSATQEKTAEPKQEGKTKEKQ
jgi:large subunit ribosomal protein L19